MNAFLQFQSNQEFEEIQPWLFRIETELAQINKLKDGLHTSSRHSSSEET
jgi:hypothetical protein